MISEELINKLIQAGIEYSEAKKELHILEKEFQDLEKIKSIVEERIKSRKPLQYLLEKAYFMDFEVKTNHQVLIPRPETEILVEETIKKISRNKKVNILDVGTGSGIIAIALAKHISEASITAIDIKKEIIDLAKENAILNHVEEKITFKVCNVFSDCFLGLIKKNKFDLIISNPPYIKEKVFLELAPEVRLHEPKIALCGSEENTSGLIYYERLIPLFPSTNMSFEIDPEISNELKKYLTSMKREFNIKKDYSGLDRCLFVLTDSG